MKKSTPCIPVIHSAHRSLMVPYALYHRYENFFIGYSSTAVPITREETFAEVDTVIASNDTIGSKYRKIGELFGRVSTYQAYVYLCQEFGNVVSKDVLDVLRPVYS